MEKKESKLGTAAAGAGKAAADLFHKARKTVVSAVDQNDDGKFDLKDVSAMAESVGAAARRTAAAVKDSADMRAYERELKTLCPIFADDLAGTDFLLPKLIHVTEMDKKHMESGACKGSVGHISVQKDLKLVHIYRDKADVFGLTFYPDLDSEIYYIDPSDKNRYIALDDYFGHLKVLRITELQKIAQDLGAVHFKVTYKEEREAQSVKKGTQTVKSPVEADVRHEASTTDFSSVEIAAEMTCPGHAPAKPQLKYLQMEPAIQSLIALRMDKKSPITHQKYTLKLSNSSGIKESDAIKIDAALKSMKCSGHAVVAAEARREAKRFFEYEIDF